MALILLLPLLAAGCGPVASPCDESFQRAMAEAAVAFAEAEIERERPATPQTVCDDCAGTGTVPSGDGLARVPCVCGDACRCERDPARQTDISQSTPRRKRLLYFSATWCVPCRVNEATLAALAARGWKIGSGEENHIQTIDVDDRSDLPADYGIDAVPTWILIDDGIEQRRQYGILDPFEVGTLFDD